FSSRRRHTRFSRDWSSDVCSSDLATLAPRPGMAAPVPPLRKRPLATMRDMGMGAMDHGAAGQGETAACTPEHAAMGHCAPGGEENGRASGREEVGIVAHGGGSEKR